MCLGLWRMKQEPQAPHGNYLPEEQTQLHHSLSMIARIQQSCMVNLALPFWAICKSDRVARAE